jgi:hypothetical protein
MTPTGISLDTVSGDAYRRSVPFVPATITRSAPAAGSHRVSSINAARSLG